MNKLLWYVWHVGHCRERYDPDFWRHVGRPRVGEHTRKNRRLMRERPAAPAMLSREAER
jgi:hypothetical protein